MKFILIAFAPVILCSCMDTQANNTRGSLDSLSSNVSPVSSIKSTSDPKQGASRKKELMKFVSEKKDDFKQISWIKPKDAPNYVNYNGIYCYFSKDGESVDNFRFVIQYAADDWLFIRSYDFLIDGKPYRIFIPNEVQRDNGEDGIWEWSDSEIGKKYADLIEALANAKTAKIRFEGDRYYKDRSITSSQLKSIKRVYELYVAMGGKFD